MTVGERAQQEAQQGAQERAERFGRVRTRPNPANATAGGCRAFGVVASAVKSEHGARVCARRAVAFHGVKCYTCRRCAAMGDEIPATERNINGTNNSFPVRVKPYASRIVSHLCAGGVFANGDEIP